MGRKAHQVLVVFTFASYNFNSFLPVNNSFNDFGIINKPNFFSNLNIDNLKEILKPKEAKLLWSREQGCSQGENLWLSFNGGCSLTVERAVVVRKTRVRLPLSALNLLRKSYQMNLWKRFPNKPLRKVSKTNNKPLEKGFQNINFEDKITISDDLVHLS